MNWIPVTVRVPDNRRKVLTWGCAVSPYGLGTGPLVFQGVSRCNVSPSGHLFDSERPCRSWFSNHRKLITHWAEITPPEEEKLDGSA